MTASVGALWILKQVMTLFGSGFEVGDAGFREVGEVGGLEAVCVGKPSERTLTLWSCLLWPSTFANRYWITSFRMRDTMD